MRLVVNKIAVPPIDSINILLIAKFQEIELNQQIRTKNTNSTTVLDMVSGRVSSLEQEIKMSLARESHESFLIDNSEIGYTVLHGEFYGTINGQIVTRIPLVSQQHAIQAAHSIYTYRKLNLL